MSDKHEPGMAFSMPKLNKIMAFLSFILLVTTIWVFLDDYIRPWKAIQVEAIKIKRQHTELAIQAAQKEIDAPKLIELKAALSKGQELVNSRKSEITKVEKELNRVRASIKAQTIKNGFYNGDSTALNYQYEAAAREGHEKEASEKLEQLRKLKAEFASSKNISKGLELKEKEILQHLAELNTEVISVEKNLKIETGKLELLEMAKKQTDFGPIFALRNLPFLDFLDPTIKIQQIVLANVTDDRYFRQIEKVDRCITCHAFIDTAGYEKEKNPFKTHPKLDLMVGAESKHPMKQVGCTTCHGGEGHRVNDFVTVAHTPNDEKQEKEWIKKYGWKEAHHIAQPMFKLSQTEAGCVKCHSGVELIPGATVLNEGRQAIIKNGCYACHKIQGWEDKRKPGPSLLKIASKVDKEWFKSWVWAPRSINAHSKMPSFFGQSNNSTPEFTKLNLVEVNAIAEYIWEKSKDYKPNEKFRTGNSDHGKKLIGEIGCLACHGVDGLEAQSKKIGAFAGPYLTGIGSKVQPDWLVSWLKKPWHYQEDTIMPSMRLSDVEANDIATYLLSLKNPKVEGMKFAEFNKTDRDALLADYLSAFDTIEVAKDKVSKMEDHAKTMDLGKRSIGKYGCYSCHNIEGFEGIPPIGTELTKEGSKPITQFAFGLQHQVPMKRDAWITAHLQNPRMWDIGIDKAFRDKLKMPNFYLSESEATKITTALLGQVADVVPMTGIKRYSAGEALYNDGMKVVNKFNCVGCHQVDGMRGDILRGYEDDINLGPPRLVREGQRVQPIWMYHFLGNVVPIRPTLTIRMPSFNLSLQDKNRIIAGFQQGATQGTYEEPAAEVTWAPGERDQAIKLFNAYACTTCHTIGFNKNPAMAPDLHKASARLRPSWIKLWLRDPQKILPGTTMPTFFSEEGKGNELGFFDGDANKQINALTKYVIELGGVGPK
jgi:mono/diheme cytochrome c family protein